MKKISIEKKIKTLKLLGFSVSFLEYEGCILDDREKKLRCSIFRDTDIIVFSKYYNLESKDIYVGNRFVSRFSCAYHFLKDNEDPIEIILFHIERTYHQRTTR